MHLKREPTHLRVVGKKQLKKTVQNMDPSKHFVVAEHGDSPKLIQEGSEAPQIVSDQHDVRKMSNVLCEIL